MLLQWRRGVRGLEYCTLYVMMEEIADLVGKGTAGSLKDQSSVRGISSFILEKVSRIAQLLIPFIEKATRLLFLERQAMQNGHITYEKCDDSEIQEIRYALFSNSKSYGGMFKELIDEVDGLLYCLISRQVLCS